MTNNIEDALSNLLLLENQYKLDDIRISNLPIWNILKYNVRRKYLVEKGICESLQSKKNRISFSKSLIGMYKSFCKLLRIIIVPTKVDNFVMGFSRLDYINNEYIDRFTDPVIEFSNLKNNYLCFEYGRTGVHMRPRKNQERVVYTDFAYMLSFIWGYIALLPFSLLHYKELQNLKNRIFKVTTLEFSLFYLSKTITEFKCNANIFFVLIKRLGAKRVFGVSRILFKHVSYAAKKEKLPVYEFQHGITLGLSELYAGNYIREIDPDYFFLFGDSCPSNVFGIPQERILNIGWAFKHYLQGVGGDNHKVNCCLVISEPQISNQIIDVTLLLAKRYPHIIFHIRRHPQEIFSKEQIMKFANVSNIIDNTNKKNSVLVAMAYDYIIGENSTVLFEGLSLGKKIARLNIGGLQPVNRSNEDSFYYIDSVEDFGDYINSPVKELKTEVYSDFKANLFNSFIS